MSQFTPYSALAGGALIGLAATVLLWLDGRIAGVSGVFGGLLAPARHDRGWRALFLLGLIVGASGYASLAGAGAVAAPRQGQPVGLLLLAGVLTGFGTALANGCTSGHGVCGLARFSIRSLVATLTFLGVAIITTFAVRHLLGFAA